LSDRGSWIVFEEEEMNRKKINCKMYAGTQFYKLIDGKAKKIAILVPNFLACSGDARVVELQTGELAEEGNDVAIFTLGADIKPKNAKLFVIGMPKSLIWQRVYRLIFPMDLIKTFRWLPKLKDFDLVISHLYPMNWLAFLAKKFYKTKYIFWYHGIQYPEVYSHLYERIYLKMFIFLTKLTVQNVDHAVSVSNAGRKEFKKYTGIDSEVIYNRHDSIRFYKGIDGSEIRKKHNLGNDPVLLNVGRVCPQKGAHLLIEAFDLVKEKIPNAKLVIVGEHTYNYYSKELKEKSDSSVIFAGCVSDEELPQYYAMCDVYATCSLYEVHNVPVLEVQACGKTVVAFDIAPFEEGVDENGILVENGNVEKFAEACIHKLREVRGGLVE
jgi:1,2-diacylglycerol 3-alpha-glucosyltransferase